MRTRLARHAADRAMAMALGRIVTAGSLAVSMPGGTRLRFGDGGGAPVAIRLADETAVWLMLLDPELRLGELYMDGRLVVEEGSLSGFLDLLLRNARGSRAFFRLNPFKALRERRWAATPGNDPGRARRNVERHYDLDGRFYSLFLDPDRQYSCAYFATPDASLEEAQAAKQRHIAAKLHIRPGDRVLDIGGGWGGLARYLARGTDAAEILGITLSREQNAYANEAAAAAGLDPRVRSRIEDYRTVAGPFDRVVSVGMFEHVGPRSYEAYFETCRRVLREDGIALVHTIARTGEPCAPNPWVRRYIFPGGHIPTLSEIAPALERSGLVLTDLEVWRLHYALTLRHWRERFLARRAEAVALTDERFCRMWEFYLAAFEAGFRHEDLVVFQMQLARRNDTLPLTRDYMAEAEARLMARDRAAAQEPDFAALRADG